MAEEKKSKAGNKRTLAGGSQVDMEKGRSKEASRSFHIVAIGASAGGIDAFQKFLGSLPPDSGMAFVFILHLSPDQKSMLSDIMGQYTQMEVSQIEHGMKVEPNRVYVIPPNADLRISEGRLTLSKLPMTKGIRQPIDHFFRSLAKSCEENAIGIILSGTGSDGALGIKAIKAHGGLVVAQEPESAQYSGMPRSAIETGIVDLILPLEKIPERLIEFSRRSLVMHKRERPQEVLQTISEVLPKILQAIQKQTGHNFSSYKTSTMIRRITRRMVVNGFDDPLDYLKFLKETHDEGQFLFQDLLISVTQFFRDAEAFDILKEKVIGPIVQGHEGEDPIKVWIPGCATGEEAYTIAILFREKMNELNRQYLKIQIFATDLDELAINYARLGRFPDNISVDMTAERLEKFFRKVDDVYQVANSVREMIIFSLHNLTNNPPFSKLNLVCCRNLLIYLNADMQRKILPLFHYALKPQGYLLLGTSETLGSFDELFDVIDKRWKIFQRKESSKPLAIDFPLKAIEPLRQGEKLVSSAMTRSQAGNMAEKALLQRYSPPSVVVNEKFEIIHFSTRISRYLEQPVGEPTMNILKMAREDLRPKLRVGLRKAISSQETNFYYGLKLQINGNTEVLNLIVEALREPTTNQRMALVVFEPVRSMANKSSAKDSPVSTNGRETSEIEVKQLEEDLRVTSEQLQSTIEELETSNEELKSSNEELMSMNEELQSTNEEVESSKEELQALNEELTTVNSELERNVDELAEANSFMQNLLNSSQVATVFLDRKLRLKRFTPDATEIFNVIESDIDRPFHHITGNLDYPTINKDAEQVLKTLKSIETEVQSSEGKSYLLRILPYRTINDVIDGVVITLIDITDRKQSEQALKESAEKLRKLADSMPQLVWSADVDGRIVYINEHYKEFKGIMQRQDGSWEWEPILHSDDRERTVAAWQAAIQDENGYQIEHRIKCADDSYRWFLSRAKLVKDNKEQSIMWFGTATDIDDLKKTEQALAEARKNAEAAAQAKSDFLANMSHEIRTPMTIFLGALEHLQAIDNIPEHRKLLDMAEKSSKHLRELIDDILDFSQIEAGRVEFFETSFNLRSWLEEIISMFKLTAEEKGLELKGTLSKNVPEIIVGDSSRLQQVLINLIGNAIKFTAEGEVSVTVKVRGKQLVFAVTDTGIGIAKDKQHLLFQNFSQVDASFHRQHTGTGLGLAISKKLVELMGGKIIMQKRPEQGSIFTVTLPLKMTSMTEIKKRPETDVCEVGLSNVCILLADDDPMICELVTMELSSRGWQTDVATNGEEAITKWQQGDYDAILMDLQMPGMDGLEATRMIRRKEEGQGKHICVIGFTAHARQKTLKDCLEAGMDGVLTKPIRTEDLYAIINKCLI